MKAQDLKVGERYNWIGQPERLVYLGVVHHFADSRAWYQFAKVGEDKVWCEILAHDMRGIEPTVAQDRFAMAWENEVAIKGYQYGEDAMQQVRLGWDIAIKYLPRRESLPDGWIVMWPAPGGGHRPIYTEGSNKPSYGPQLDALLTQYPVYKDAR